MTLVVRLEEDYTDGNELVDDGADGLETLLVAAGWTLLDEVDDTADQQDRVYHSSGEDSNQEIYLRITHDGVTRRVSFRTYSLWNDTTHVGYNEVGDVAGNSSVDYPAGGFDAGVVLTADHWPWWSRTARPTTSSTVAWSRRPSLRSTRSTAGWAHR